MGEKTNHQRNLRLCPSGLLASGFVALFALCPAWGGESASQDTQPAPVEAEKALQAKADGIVRLLAQIQADRSQLREAEHSMNRRDGEYNMALAEFQQAAAALSDAETQQKSLQSLGKTKEAEAIGKTMPKLQANIKSARNRFILALRERQILREQVETLKEKTRKQYDDLNKATGATDIERVASLRISLEVDVDLLNQLKASLEKSLPAYLEDHRTLESLARELGKKSAELAALQSQKKLKEAEKMAAVINELDKSKQAAQAKLDQGQAERRAQAQQIATFEKGIAFRKALIEALTKSWSMVNLAVAAPPGADSQKPAGKEPEEKAAPEPDAKKNNPAALPVPGGLPVQPPANAKKKNNGDGQENKASDIADQKAVKAAQETAKLKTEDAKKAEESVRLLEAQMERVKKLIEQEQALLSTAQQQLKNAQDAKKELQTELAKKKKANAEPEELEALQKKIQDAETRIPSAQASIAKAAKKILDLNVDLAGVQGAHAAAVREAEQRQKEAEAAQRRIEELQNPFAPQNLWRWLYRHGPPVLGIILIVIVLRWLVGRSSSRIVSILSRYGARGSEAERLNRAETLVGVFRNTASLVIFTGGALMIFNEFGIDVAVLMGGAAVVGLAVAFGAQNLIRDYFYGFIILLENQYIVRDVVRIGAIAGVVERITLRMTVLRDLEGTVHFIPNGQIASVSNLTQEWSRALFDVSVAYKENVDHVLQVLRKLGDELRSDDSFMPMILEDLKMLGVDAFGDSGVVIRFYIQTWPGKQWEVKREMLRRIKNRFDELGIEIPFPHRTVFLRKEQAA